GAGLAPIAPGTAGSAATALLLWLVPVSPLGRGLACAIVTVAGVAASGRVERLVGEKDPGRIVIDEVAGMILSVLVLPLTPAVLLCAFLLFRVFDVVKPFPADRAQALPGGFGVMADDLIAGAYALALLAGVRAWLGVPAPERDPARPERAPPHRDRGRLPEARPADAPARGAPGAPPAGRHALDRPVGRAGLAPRDRHRRRGRPARRRGRARRAPGASPPALRARPAGREGCGPGPHAPDGRRDGGGSRGATRVVPPA